MPKKWELKEASDSLAIGGKRVKGSGNLWYAPGDSKSDIYLQESKQTDKASYSLSKKRLLKLYQEALFSYRVPLFSVKIQEVDVVLMFKEDWVKLADSKKE